MGGMIDPGEGEDRPLAEINVTPLVDVMLVLLVIFIILAPAMAGSLRVNLPKVAGEPLSVTTPVVITVEADGSTRLGTERVDETALAGQLRALAGANPELQVRIDGDGETPYRQIARLLALIQGQGIRRIAFATRTP